MHYLLFIRRQNKKFGTRYKKNGTLSIPKYVAMLTCHFKERCPSWEPLQAMHVLRSVLCAVMLHAHTLIATPKCSTKQWALHPGAMGLMIINFGKAGYALGVQECKDRSLCGAKKQALVELRVAVRTIHTSSYKLGRTSKRLPISLWQNPEPVCFIDKQNDYI